MCMICDMCVIVCVYTHLFLLHLEDGHQFPVLTAVGCGVIQAAPLLQCPHLSPRPPAERSGKYFIFKSSVHAQQDTLECENENKETINKPHNILFVETVEIYNVLKDI